MNLDPGVVAAGGSTASCLELFLIAFGYGGRCVPGTISLEALSYPGARGRMARLGRSVPGGATAGHVVGARDWSCG